jgi:hypothetical protein
VRFELTKAITPRQFSSSPHIPDRSSVYIKIISACPPPLNSSISYDAATRNFPIAETIFALAIRDKFVGQHCIYSDENIYTATKT